MRWLGWGLAILGAAWTVMLLASVISGVYQISESVGLEGFREIGYAGPGGKPVSAGTFLLYVIGTIIPGLLALVVGLKLALGWKKKDLRD